MMVLSEYVLVFFCSLFLFSANTQGQESYRVAFLNCENLMDTIDDKDTRDEEFTPSGLKHWNTSKYYHKLRQLSKIVLSLGEWRELAVLGLAEVENRKVVEDLLKYTALKNKHYKIVHYESPDSRGIDVALLYSSKLFTLLASKPIGVNLGNERSTRDILHVKGVTNKNDTLHILVNHWPSRWGGQINSESRRVAASNTLQSYLKQNGLHTKNTIIIGDFNDDPTNKSITSLTKGSSIQWMNLVETVVSKFNGTHYYHEEWSMLDQIIVSKALVDSSLGLTTKSMQIHLPAFCLKYQNSIAQPLRSYRGMRYEGGFSDHLAVYADIYKLVHFKK